MSYESIDYKVDNGIAVLTLNRPDRLNSFTQAMHLEVRDALETLQADKTVRVLVLTGAGRGFCAGQDLGDRAVAPGAPGVDLGESVEKFYAPLVLTLRSLPLQGRRRQCRDGRELCTGRLRSRTRLRAELPGLPDHGHGDRRFRPARITINTLRPGGDTP